MIIFKQLVIVSDPCNSEDKIKSITICDCEKVIVLCVCDLLQRGGKFFSVILQSKFNSLLMGSRSTDVKRRLDIILVLLCFLPPGQKCYLLFIIWFVLPFELSCTRQENRFQII